MDSLPTYSPPTASKHEQTLVVSSELANILGCDLTEANGIWEKMNRSRTEKEVQMHLEVADIFKSNTDPSKIFQVFQLIQSHQKTITCVIP